MNSSRYFSWNSPANKFVIRGLVTFVSCDHIPFILGSTLYVSNMWRCGRFCTAVNGWFAGKEEGKWSIQLLAAPPLFIMRHVRPFPSSNPLSHLQSSPACQSYVRGVALSGTCSEVYIYAWLRYSFVRSSCRPTEIIQYVENRFNIARHN